jgi:hypothetical protein
MTDDDNAPPTAADSLRLIEEQTAATERSLTPDPRVIYWPWGLAWLIGFALLYLRFGPRDQVLWDIPGWLPLATLYTLMAMAFVVSGVAGARAGRQVRGESSTKGTMYGISWFLGFAGTATVASRLSGLLPEAETGLMWAALSVGVVAVLYLAGGAVWGSRDLFVLGVWIGVVNILGVLAGPGWHSLIISVAGGGGLIVFGLLAKLKLGSATRRDTAGRGR